MTRFLALIAPRPGRHLLGRPAGATCSDFHAPAASLGTAYAGLRQGAGRNRIAAGAMPLVRPAISLLPRPCPVTPPRGGAPWAAHALPPRRAADRSALLRGFGRVRSAIAALRRGRPGGLAPIALGPRAVLLRRHPLRRVALLRCAASLAAARAAMPLLAAVHPPARGRFLPAPLPGPAGRGSRLRRSCV